MATEDEVDDKRIEARLAILENIIRSQGAPRYVLELAEAYAWLSKPDNSHGGGSSASV